MRTFLIISFIFQVLIAFGQNKTALPAAPKLIVGIVVDQMRYDYLYRYQAKYGDGGFKRLLREGFSCENTHYNYVPTYTAPGHAALYTGTTPSVNGIIGNEWWDPEWDKHRYVTTDERYKTVGATGKVGQHSPAVLLTTTITDELRLATNFRSKVAGVCLKDRGSILPAGHIPNACYWFDDATGGWITSTYYPDSLGLPQWVQDFNNRRLPEQYLSKPWTQRLNNVRYDESYFGWAQYMGKLTGAATAGFPHDLPKARELNKNVGAIRYTPFGNTLTLDFALETIDQMQLGADADPDVLCLSFSSTDYCGHLFGIHSEEVEDTYLRLDADLERLLTTLDKKFGKDNVLVFLSADHGGAETPAHMRAIGIPADVFPENAVEGKLSEILENAFQKTGEFIHETSNQQVWLNRTALKEAGIGLESAKQTLTAALRAMPGVYDAFTREELMRLPADYPFASEWRRGLHPRRSGDLMFQLDPAWHSDDKFFLKTGTTHGSSYAYDTHVPLLWYGWRVPQGETQAPVSVTDVAPTLAAMLRIMEPNGTTGKLIEALFRK